MAVSIDEVNSLISQYLRESGFSHTAFIFGRESLIESSNVNSITIPPGSLVSILQKSLKYLRFEKILGKAGSDSGSSINTEIKAFEAAISEAAPPPKEENRPPAASTVITLSSSVATILKAHPSHVYSCHWSPDGTHLVTGGEGSAAILWTISDSSPESHIFLPYLPDCADKEISCVEWDPTGRFIAIGSFDNKVRVYNRTGLQLHVLEGHLQQIFNVRFSPNGQYLVSCGNDHFAILWDVDSGVKIRVFDIHSSTIMDVAWKDSTTFALASADQTLSICSVSGQHEIIRVHKQAVTHIGWNCDGSLFASSSSDASIIIRNISGNQKTYLGHKGGVSAFQWHTSIPNVFISGDMNGTLILWNCNMTDPIQTSQPHSKEVISLEFSPNGQYVASGGGDGLIVIFNSSDLKISAKFCGSSSVYDLKWSPDSSKLAVCFQDSTVAIIRPSNFCH